VWFEKLVMQLLEKEPERRPFNARSVQGVIKEHLEDEFGPEVDQLTQNLPPLEEASLPGTTSWVRVLVGILVIGGVIAAAIFMVKS
jgi:hypothetical protein